MTRSIVFALLLLNVFPLPGSTAAAECVMREWRGENLGFKAYFVGDLITLLDKEIRESEKWMPKGAELPSAAIVLKKAVKNMAVDPVDGTNVKIVGEHLLVKQPDRALARIEKCLNELRARLKTRESLE